MEWGMCGDVKFMDILKSQGEKAFQELNGMLKYMQYFPIKPKQLFWFRKTQHTVYHLTSL